MSIAFCPYCNKNYDQDFDAEHEDGCKSFSYTDRTTRANMLEQIELDYIDFLESEGIEYRNLENNGFEEQPNYEWQVKKEFETIFANPDLMAKELGYKDFEEYIKEEGDFSC